MENHDVYTDCTINNKHNSIGSFNNSERETEEIKRILKSSLFFNTFLIKVCIYSFGFMAGVLKAMETGCYIFFLIGIGNFLGGLVLTLKDLLFWDKIKD